MGVLRRGLFNLLYLKGKFYKKMSGKFKSERILGFYLINFITFK